MGVEVVKGINDRVRVSAAIIGALISTVSLILYTRFQDCLWLEILLSVICLIYAGFQTYKYYFAGKEWDIPSKVIISTLFFFLFAVIIFIVITIFFVYVLKLKFTYDYLIYSIYLTPSFLLVIIILILLLYVLSYA